MAAAAFVLSACGGGTATVRPSIKKSVVTENIEVERRLESQAQRIAELEVRLALLEAAANEFRALLESRRQARGETIRIGANRRREAENDEGPAEEEVAKDDGRPRPVLRLYGSGPEKAPASALVLPPSPPGVSDRLPVAPLPDGVSPGPLASTAGSKTLRASEAAIITEYRNALSLLRGGKFDEALRAFSDFIASYPGHAYADNASYWRGEVLYAKKDYEAALRQFQDVAERFPSSRKLPDSLLKIGMCHRRMGDTERARVYFRRVLRQYPDSNAARIASREDAS
jgi:tol-pal system protein YbgF